MVEWHGSSALTAGDLLLSGYEVGSKRDAAVEFLRILLSEGPVPVSEVYAAAEGAGFSSRTVDRARQKVGAKTQKDGLTGGWSLCLPE